MVLNVIKNTFLLFVLILLSCGSKVQNKSGEFINTKINDVPIEPSIEVGANQTSKYLDLLNGKQVGIVANQTSVLLNKSNEVLSHLVDTLISLEVNVSKVFAPEHGFRGTADAGEVVRDGMDTKTGTPIISLYGKNKKPSPEQLEGLDIVIFDIQDVGARFYTYISTLHYVMEACAEQNIPVLIFDRPNPNGHYIDGPILESEHQSFVGMHPIPVVHGMTIGEYAQMINGEFWLIDNLQCDITVIPLQNYSHKKPYSLPIKPSPNLPNDVAISLYPSICFFEGTNVSAGRGTEMQFQIFGSPFLDKQYFNFEFTPQPNEGSKYPKHEAKKCNGLDLRQSGHLDRINLDWLIEAYNATSDKSKFFIPFFTKLAGTAKLQEQIEQGYTAREIRKTWLKGLGSFKAKRQNYLIYD
jgi:uncharacterized protein YbbC (DUF1343 family)